MDGIINVYKPRGMTSHDVVNKIRKIAGTKKVGHTGTLDPGAEGVLPICINRATKAADMLEVSDKRYTASFKLGVVTDTYDIGGNVVKTREINVSDSDIYEVVKSFVGKSEQIPPMYSAVKVGGKKLYDLARKGVEIERKPRSITVYGIEILNVDNDSFTVDVKCSKGTYIRTLGYDIGEKLGCGATMTSLVRTQSSLFTVDSSVKLCDITPENYSDFVVPTDQLFDYEKLTVRGEVLRKILNGNSVKISAVEDEKMYRVYADDGRFLCVSRSENGILKVEKMFYVGE